MEYETCGTIDCQLNGSVIEESALCRQNVRRSDVYRPKGIHPTSNDMYTKNRYKKEKENDKQKDQNISLRLFLGWMWLILDKIKVSQNVLNIRKDLSRIN
jgi:hypothetical protein